MDISEKPSYQPFTEASYQRLFEDHYAWLLRIAYHHSSDWDLSKEVVQGLFVHIWEKRVQLPLITYWPAYLRKALMRALAQSQKQQSRFQPLTPQLDQDHQSPSYEANLIQHQEGEAQKAQVQAALSHLPQQEKKVLLLRFQEGFSYEEIAEITGRSKQTIYNQIHSAIKRLKKALLSAWWIIPTVWDTFW